jgi:hypothetical protein
VAVEPDHPSLGADGRQLHEYVRARRHAPVIADFCNKIGPKRTFVSRCGMSAFGGNVLQNSLLHCERATIESWWTARRINVAHFRLKLNQCFASSPSK